MAGIAVVTGAASGIGRETAFTFAERGARHVLFADIDVTNAHYAAEESEKYASHPQYSARAYAVDVADERSVDLLIARVVEEYGPIDYAVHSAGIGGSVEAPMQNIKPDLFDSVHQVNARGTFLFIRAVVKAMSKQKERFTSGRSGERSIGRGAIVVMSSLAGLVPVPTHVQYNASKAAVNSIAQCAASENARNGIRINTLCPTWVDTPLNRAFVARTPGLSAEIKAKSPAERMMKPEEVAEVAWFLCSPSGSYLNGLALPVDAGFSVTRGYA